MSKAKTVVGAVALALVLFGMSGGADADAAQPPAPEPTPPGFEPFYVGTPQPGALEVDYIIRYAPTPEAGRAECLDVLSYYTQATPETSGYCEVRPDSSPEHTQDSVWGPDGLVRVEP